jgi:lipopolysaccharide/colanic/teichoic acid biosynthesis glycosyltransferase
MRFSKRFFDLFWTTLGLLVLWPMFLLVALAIKLSDGGPVFFRQERLGRGGGTIKVWKFRTMKVDPGGEPITVKNDPRVTRVGRFLRATRLDELPQLLNVLGGSMSLVGPRPEVAKYAAHYTDEQRRVLQFTPGITDPAMIKLRAYRDSIAEGVDPEEHYLKHVMPEKVRTSIEYAERANVLTDFVIIVRTLLRV